MKDETRKLLDKAGRAIHSAEVLLAAGEVDFAAGSAYYAMFYTAQALLFERGLSSRKHSGVHALFGEHFARTALMDPKFHRWLVAAFNRRLQGDYGFEATITVDEVKDMVAQAREFLRAAQSFLGPSG